MHYGAQIVLKRKKEGDDAKTKIFLRQNCCQLSTFKNTKKFVSSFYRLHRINLLVSIFILTTGTLVFATGAQHATMSVIMVVCYLVSITLGVVFDILDHRVYVSDESVSIKVKGITKKYQWCHLNLYHLSNDNTIVFVFTNGEIVNLKRILHVEQLLKVLELHNIQS